MILCYLPKGESEAETSVFVQTEHWEELPNLFYRKHASANVGGCTRTVCSSDKVAHSLWIWGGAMESVNKSPGLSRTWSVWISFEECPACVTLSFQNMLPSLVVTQHLPRPLMKLMTLALLQHTAVLSIVGKEDMVSRVVLNQDKCSLVKSTNVHALCVSWLCSAGHSFHGAQSQQRVCFEKWE